MSNSPPDPDFSLFHHGVGAKVFQKLTGASGDKLTTWTELQASLVRFGQGSDPSVRALREKGLNGLDFFSSSEELVAVPMLLVADLGSVADKIANESRWWSSYTRVADDATRRLVGKLLSL